jgi:hypothetical protein
VDTLSVYQKMIRRWCESHPPPPQPAESEKGKNVTIIISTYIAHVRSNLGMTAELTTSIKAIYKHCNMYKHISNFIGRFSYFPFNKVINYPHKIIIFKKKIRTPAVPGMH